MSGGIVAGGVPVIATQEDFIGSSFSTSSVTFVDITGLLVTLPNNDGRAQILLSARLQTNMANAFNITTVQDNITDDVAQTLYRMVTTAHENTIVHNYVASNDGQVIQGRARVDVGTGTWVESNGTWMRTFEVS